MSERRSRILILGAGRVAGPAVDYLATAGHSITISDLSEINLHDFIGRHPNVTAVQGDAATDVEALIDSVKPELVLCLLPPSFIPFVMKHCLVRSINLVHPAYVDSLQRSLASEIKEAGVVMIGELGLDPGIDHMSAAHTIDRVHKAGFEVESFRSLCGAIPAADSNNNPWCYKLSWAPETLLATSLRSARVLLDGVEQNWPDGQTFEHIHIKEIPGLGCYEAYANGDSLVYRDLYGIPEVKTLYRGTLRYLGWSETISTLNSLGVTGNSVLPLKGQTFLDFTAGLLGTAPNLAADEFCKRFALKKNSAVFQRLSWLGFFDDNPIPISTGTPMDVLSCLFRDKLVYAEGERDLIVLADEFVIKEPLTQRREWIRSTLVDFGKPGGYSAIARTTGVPPAIAADLILKREIKTPGLYIPSVKEIYSPILRELASLGIQLKEESGDTGLYLPD